MLLDDWQPPATAQNTHATGASTGGWGEQSEEMDQQELEATSSFITFDQQMLMFPKETIDEVHGTSLGHPLPSMPSSLPASSSQAQEPAAAPVSPAHSHYPNPLYEQPPHSQPPAHAAALTPGSQQHHHTGEGSNPMPYEGWDGHMGAQEEGGLRTQAGRPHGGLVRHVDAHDVAHGSPMAAAWSHQLSELSRQGAAPGQVVMAAASAMANSPQHAYHPPGLSPHSARHPSPSPSMLDANTVFANTTPGGFTPGPQSPYDPLQPTIASATGHLPLGSGPTSQPQYNFPSIRKEYALPTPQPQHTLSNSQPQYSFPTTQRPHTGSTDQPQSYPLEGMAGLTAVPMAVRTVPQTSDPELRPAASVPVWESQDTFNGSPQHPSMWDHNVSPDPSTWDDAPRGQAARAATGLGSQAGGARRSGSTGTAAPAHQQQVEKLQAHVTALESGNQELQRRLAELVTRLEQSTAAAQRHAEAEQTAKAAAAESESHVKAREAQLHVMERQVEALASELQSTRAALGREQAGRQGAEDEVVRWKSESQALHKELEDTVRKLHLIGAEERRLQSELMTLKNNHGVLGDMLAKAKVEVSEARERARLAAQEAERHMGAAARLEQGSEGLGAQVNMLRHKVAELEGRNLGLQEEVRSLRTELHRSVEAAGVAALRSGHTLASRPAGRSSIGGDTGVTVSRRGAGGQWQAEGAGMATALRSAGQEHLMLARREEEGYAYPTDGSNGYSATLAQDAQSRRPLGYQGGSDVTYAYHPAGPATTYAPARSSLEWQTRTAAAEPPNPRYPPYPPPSSAYTPATQPPPTSAYGGASGAVGGGYDPVASGYGGMPGAYGSQVQVSSPRPPEAPPQTDDTSRDWRAPTYRSQLLEELEYRMNKLNQSRDELNRTDRSLNRSRDELYRDDQSLNRSREGPFLARTGAAASGYGVGSPGRGAEGGLEDGYLPAGASAPAPAPVHGRAYTSYLLPGPATTAAAAAIAGRATAQQQLEQQQADTFSGAHPDQQHQTGLDVPFGTERTLKDLLGRSQAMETALVKLCAEKSQLDSELARMPAHAGRNGKTRSRKAEVETRLEEVHKEISNLRLTLKKMHGK